MKKIAPYFCQTNATRLYWVTMRNPRRTSEAKKPKPKRRTHRGRRAKVSIVQPFSFCRRVFKAEINEIRPRVHHDHAWQLFFGWLFQGGPMPSNAAALTRIVQNADDEELRVIAKRIEVAVSDKRFPHYYDAKDRGVPAWLVIRRLRELKTATS